jgi:LytR cell envelope-related transcriptional attenuator
MMVGGIVIGVVVLALVISSLGSSSGNGPQANSAGAPARSHRAAVSPADTSVTVLNGTTAEGLAHRLAANLQKDGYSQATALGGTPPGDHQTSVVQYSPGHRAEAEQVARLLGVSAVQPVEASVVPLAGGATVVVVVGLDKAGPGAEAASPTEGEAASETGESGAVENEAAPSAEESPPAEGEAGPGAGEGSAPVEGEAAPGGESEAGVTE